MLQVIRTLIALVLALFVVAVPAVQADLATDPGSIVAGSAITSSQLNGRFAPLFTTVNGLLSNNNIKAGAAIDPAKFDSTKAFPLQLLAAATAIYKVGNTGDTQPRFQFDSDGKLKWGAGGASAVDVMLKRDDATTLRVRDAADANDRDLKVRNGTASGVLTAPSFLTTAGGTVGLVGSGGNALTMTPANFAAARAITVPDPLGAANLTFSTGTLNAGGLIYTDGATLKSAAASGTTLQPLLSGDASTAPTNLNAHIAAGGRIVLNTTTPLANTSFASSINYIPWSSNVISLYDGTSQWKQFTIPTALSITLPATTNTNYDVFIYNNAGTPALELLAWSTDTARATALSMVNSSWMKSTDTTRRFLGIVRTQSAGNTTDLESARFYWNNYNRVLRPVYAGYAIASVSYIYGTATWRVTNGGASTDGIQFVGGAAHGDTQVDVSYNSALINTAGAIGGAISIGLDGAMLTVGTPVCMIHNPATAVVGTAAYPGSIRFRGIGGPTGLTVGYHTLNGMECANSASATLNWYGNPTVGATSVYSNYLSGFIWQ